MEIFCVIGPPYVPIGTRTRTSKLACRQLPRWPAPRGEDLLTRAVRHATVGPALVCYLAHIRGKIEVRRPGHSHTCCSSGLKLTFALPLRRNLLRSNPSPAPARFARATPTGRGDVPTPNRTRDACSCAALSAPSAPAPGGPSLPRVRADCLAACLRAKIMTFAAGRAWRGWGAATPRGVARPAVRGQHHGRTAWGD